MGTRYFDPKKNSWLYVIERGMASGEGIAVAVVPGTSSAKTVMIGEKMVKARFQALP